MWGIIPAAGVGSRIQPLAFSKELLPVGSRIDAATGTERPRAVSEYLIDRMLLAGATRICFVISPGKSDILEYYGAEIGPARVAYVVQPRAAGLCDALFRALPLIAPGERVLVGLPDTIWFPENGYTALPAGELAFLTFPVARPEHFDAVVADEGGRVREIQVKRPAPDSDRVWGAFSLTGKILNDLHRLWCDRDQQDEYVGTLVNAWLAAGNLAVAVPAGRSYVDVGTLNGWREALGLLTRQEPPTANDVRAGTQRAMSSTHASHP